MGMDTGVDWADPADTGSFLCIDLKSFYASVECLDLGLDPMEADLVVADASRGAGTICLAVSPHLKAQGVPGRPRLWEVPRAAPHADFVTATPRMSRYLERSGEVLACYLELIAPEDIHVYSVDECLIDVAPYRRLYGADAEALGRRLIGLVRRRTGLVATVGVGTNLFLAKVACDVVAKHAPDFVGVLDGERFRRTIWGHRPLTDIWGVGPRTAARLERRFGARCLADVSRIPYAELRAEFGVNARHLADHSRGIEACTMADVKAWHPQSTSISNGQVLPRDYSADEALVVVREMLDESVLELTQRALLASSVQAWAGWSWDHAGAGPGTAGQVTLPSPTDARSALAHAVERILRPRLDPRIPVRRVGICLGGLVPREASQPTLFEDEGARLAELALQETVLAARRRFGPTSVMRGRSLREAATGYERNRQIGGHRA